MMDMSPFQSLVEAASRADTAYGVVVGVVTNNQDPEGLGRVRVRFPWLSDEDESNWAQVATPMAGKERGLFFLPEVEDTVLVAFLHGDMRFPYVLGALWNGKDPPPEVNDDGKNNLRTLRSRSGHLIRLDDTEGKEKIEIIGQGEETRVVIDTSENSIMVSAKGDVTVEATDGKLILKGNGVEITSQAAVTVEAGKDLDLTAKAQLNVKGEMVNIN